MRRTNVTVSLALLPWAFLKAVGCLVPRSRHRWSQVGYEGGLGTCMFACGRVLLVTTALGVAWQVGLGQRTQE